MGRLRDFYFLLFYFWFRLDHFSKKREHKALKAVGTMSFFHALLLLGCYRWGEFLIGLPSPRLEELLAVAAAVFIGNHVMLRRRGWEEFERKFVLLPADVQQTWMAVAGATNIAAVALLVSAPSVVRSVR